MGCGFSKSARVYVAPPDLKADVINHFHAYLMRHHSALSSLFGQVCAVLRQGNVNIETTTHIIEKLRQLLKTANGEPLFRAYAQLIVNTQTLPDLSIAAITYLSRIYLTYPSISNTIEELLTPAKAESNSIINHTLNLLYHAHALSDETLQTLSHELAPWATKLSTLATQLRLKDEKRLRQIQNHHYVFYPPTKGLYPPTPLEFYLKLMQPKSQTLAPIGLLLQQLCTIVHNFYALRHDHFFHNLSGFNDPNEFLLDYLSQAIHKALPTLPLNIIRFIQPLLSHFVMIAANPNRLSAAHSSAFMLYLIFFKKLLASGLNMSLLKLGLYHDLHQLMLILNLTLYYKGPAPLWFDASLLHQFEQDSNGLKAELLLKQSPVDFLSTTPHPRMRTQNADPQPLMSAYHWQYHIAKMLFTYSRSDDPHVKAILRFLSSTTKMLLSHIESGEAFYLIHQLFTKSELSSRLNAFIKNNLVSYRTLLKSQHDQYLSHLHQVLQLHPQMQLTTLPTPCTEVLDHIIFSVKTERETKALFLQTLLLIVIDNIRTPLLQKIGKELKPSAFMRQSQLSKARVEALSTLLTPKTAPTACDEREDKESSRLSKPAPEREASLLRYTHATFFTMDSISEERSERKQEIGLQAPWSSSSSISSH